MPSGATRTWRPGRGAQAQGLPTASPAVVRATVRETVCTIRAALAGWVAGPLLRERRKPRREAAIAKAGKSKAKAAKKTGKRAA